MKYNWSNYELSLNNKKKNKRNKQFTDSFFDNKPVDMDLQIFSEKIIYNPNLEKKNKIKISINDNLKIKVSINDNYKINFYKLDENDKNKIKQNIAQFLGFCS